MEDHEIPEYDSNDTSESSLVDISEEKWFVILRAILIAIVAVGYIINIAQKTPEYLESGYMASFMFMLCAALIALFAAAYWRGLREWKRISRFLFLAAVPIFLLIAVMLIPESSSQIDEVADFWGPFIEDDQSLIVVGTPLVWLGPYDPDVRPVDLPPGLRFDRRVEVYDGAKFLSVRDSVPLLNISYFLPSWSFSNIRDMSAALMVRDLLLPRVQLSIVACDMLERDWLSTADKNLILVGGPVANPAVELITEVWKDRDVDFGFKFLVRARRGVYDGALMKTVGTEAKVGICNTHNKEDLIVEYRPEGLSPGHRVGMDGAIVIKAPHPNFPERTVLIIAGFEENGTIAAINRISRPLNGLDYDDGTPLRKGDSLVMVIRAHVSDGDVSPADVAALRQWAPADGTP